MDEKHAKIVYQFQFSKYGFHLDRISMLKSLISLIREYIPED